MNKFALIDAGVVSNITIGQPATSGAQIAIDITALAVQPQIGWGWNGTAFTPPPVMVVDYGSQIAPSAFLKRLGLDVEIAIEVAAGSDPTIRVLLRRLSMTKRYVDLQDKETQDSLGLLVQKGILTQTRADRVLGDPVRQEELP